MDVNELLERGDVFAESAGRYRLTLEYKSASNPRTGFPKAFVLKVNDAAEQVFGLPDTRTEETWTVDITADLKVGSNTITLTVDVYDFKVVIGDFKSTGRVLLEGPRGVVFAEVYDAKLTRRLTVETISLYMKS